MMTETTPTPTPMIEPTELVAAIDCPTDDGTIPLPDGRTIRYRFTPDEWSNPMDDMGEGAWTGRVEFGTRHPYTGYDQRPDGMDGRARKLQTRGGDPVWWQVPADVPDDAIADFGRSIADLLEYGYTVATVDLCETVVNSRGEGHTVVVNSASLGGIEPFPTEEYACEVLAELIAEVLA